jgi:circadian clock protein KaiC
MIVAAQGGLSALSDVVVVVRYVELRSRLFRLISLFKMRAGAFDPTIREFASSRVREFASSRVREFAINDDVGIVVGKPFEGVEAILSGIAREVARSAEAAPPEDHDRQSSGGSGRTG